MAVVVAASAQRGDKAADQGDPALAEIKQERHGSAQVQGDQEGNQLRRMLVDMHAEQRGYQ